MDMYQDEVREAGNQARIDRALDLIFDMGWVDGAHHKQWVLDQVARILAGDRYEERVSDFEGTSWDPDERQRWETGRAP